MIVAQNRAVLETADKVSATGDDRSRLGNARVELYRFAAEHRDVFSERLRLADEHDLLGQSIAVAWTTCSPPRGRGGGAWRPTSG